MEPIIDPLRDLAAYSTSIMAKIAPIIDDYILCKMKIEQLKAEGAKRNHLNDTHKRIIKDLSKYADKTKSEIISVLEAPFEVNKEQ